MNQILYPQNFQAKVENKDIITPAPASFEPLNGAPFPDSTSTQTKEFSNHFNQFLEESGIALEDLLTCAKLFKFGLLHWCNFIPTESMNQSFFADCSLDWLESWALLRSAEAHNKFLIDEGLKGSYSLQDQAWYIGLLIWVCFIIEKSMFIYNTLSYLENLLPNSCAIHPSPE